MSRRFVRMFKPRFAALVKAGTKRQTIRPTPKRMPKPGDILDAREWTGKPYRSKQAKIGEFVISDVRMVRITKEHFGVPTTPEVLNLFAQADGFRDWDEMVEWLEREHGLPFEGILIRF